MVSDKVSGYSFIHNGINGGYPFVEAIKMVQPFVDEMVIVDMESTDGTQDVLRKLGVKIIEGKWGSDAGDTLRQAHSQYWKCENDTILHFEADEVFDDRLIKRLVYLAKFGPMRNYSVYRLQVEQNFQRIRWYPELVHRVFSKTDGVRKEGHTTNTHDLAEIVGVEYGFLWDCTNCFRDNYLARISQQAELWHGKFNYTYAPLHINHESQLNRDTLATRLNERHWLWKKSPLKIPNILKSLVGVPKYDPHLNLNYEV